VQFVQKLGDWQCPNCPEMNFGSRVVCRKCGSNKIVDQSPQIAIDPTVYDYYLLLRNYLAISNIQVSRFSMDDGGISIEWSNFVVRVFPPENDTLEIMVHLLFKDYHRGHIIPTSAINIDVIKGIIEEHTIPHITHNELNPIDGTLTDNNVINTNEPQQPVCKICFERPVSVAFTTCGHSMTCIVCCQAMDKCPMCRKPYTTSQILNLFL
jgi:hypothetical protein